MYGIFNTLDYFDRMLCGFGSTPESFKFSTPGTKDMSPLSNWEKKEGNVFTTVVRVVGLNEDDVIIEVTDDALRVCGESEVFGATYSQEMIIPLAQDVVANIESVEYQVKNGLCKIAVKLIEPEKRRIAVTRVDKWPENVVEDPIEEELHEENVKSPENNESECNRD